MTAGVRVLALVAGALAGAALWGLAARVIWSAARHLDVLVRRAAEAARATLAPLRLASSHGRDPSARERRRLCIAGAATGAVAGWALAGVRPAILTALAAALTLPRTATWRRERYLRRVEAGAPAAAQAMAGALGGGGSVRAAIAAAGRELDGPMSVELRRTAVELEAGARLDAALEGLVDRAPSPGVVVLAAAVQLQRRSGGDLAGLMRRLAVALEDERRTTEEAGAATAQARVSANMVLVLPPLGLLFAELASPGLVGRALGSAVGATLVGIALCLQLTGTVMVRRLARVGG